MSTTTNATGQGREGEKEAGQEKTEWLIIMPDHDGALEKRMSVRPYVIFPISFRLLRTFWLLRFGWEWDSFLSSIVPGSRWGVGGRAVVVGCREGGDEEGDALSRGSFSLFLIFSGFWVLGEWRRGWEREGKGTEGVGFKDESGRKGTATMGC